MTEQTITFKNLIESSETDINFGSYISKIINPSSPVNNINAKGGIVSTTKEQVRKRAENFAKRIIAAA